MVSNLPIWPFDTERALDPNAVTIAVEIVQKSTARNKSGFGIFSVIETALFGASILNLRAVSDLVTIRLPTSLDTMGFGASYDTFLREIEAATQYARAQISSQVEDFPNLCRSAGSSAQQLVFDVLTFLAWPENGGSENAQRVRVSLAMPEGDNISSLRIKYCIGYDEDYDENILLPVDDSVVGYAWKTGKSIFECLPLRRDIDLAASRSRATRKRVPKDLKWFFALPIFDSLVGDANPTRPEFVVAIDGTGEFVAGCDLVEIREILAPRVVELYGPVVALAREIRNAEAASGPWL
jgi:NTE family protein